MIASTARGNRERAYGPDGRDKWFVFCAAARVCREGRPRMAPMPRGVSERSSGTRAREPWRAGAAAERPGPGRNKADGLGKGAGNDPSDGRQGPPPRSRQG